jgi:phenylalanyl-tRNA synthetase beta chain
LIPELLGALERNVRAGAGRIALFELGNVFAPPTGEQKRMLAIVLNGKITSTKSWRGENDRQFDFFDLKGIIDAPSPAAGYEFKRAEIRSFALAVEILAGEKRLGVCGQLSSAEASELDATGAVLLAEIDVAEIAGVRRNGARFCEIERYPFVRRDIAMFVEATVAHEKIMNVIAAAKEPLLERVELFDLFSEKSSGNGGEARKSLAYSLTYRDKNRTLTNDEVSAVHARIRERLRKEIDAELRE